MGTRAVTAARRDGGTREMGDTGEMWALGGWEYQGDVVSLPSGRAHLLPCQLSPSCAVFCPVAPGLGRERSSRVGRCSGRGALLGRSLKWLSG